jgi:hypothetical protein
MLLQTKDIKNLSLLIRKPKFWSVMLVHTKKHRKSLSPEEKTQILKSDAAAHKKQQDSLSPEEKAPILKNYAAAHKNNKSLYLPKENSNCNE